jgi:hypothetical protein
MPEVVLVVTSLLAVLTMLALAVSLLASCEIEQGAETDTRPGAQSAATPAAKFTGFETARIRIRCKDRDGDRGRARGKGRPEKIHSLDDRYDHDADEFMV